MSIKVRSAKNKGQKHQKETVEKLRKKFCLDKDEEDCFNGNISARQMGGKGIDIILSPMAREIIPFDIECKNVERLDLWGSIKQCEDNTKEGRIPLLVFKRNRSKTYCCLEFNELLKLI